MKILICGGRDFDDYKRVKAAVIMLAGSRLEVEPDTIISGGASGADACAKRLAEGGYYYQEFPANWDKHGKAAGPIRNKEMIDQNPDVVLAFWNGVSKGTANTIQLAKDKKITTFIYYY